MKVSGVRWSAAALPPTPSTSATLSARGNKHLIKYMPVTIATPQTPLIQATGGSHWCSSVCYLVIQIFESFLWFCLNESAASGHFRFLDASLVISVFAFLALYLALCAPLEMSPSTLQCHVEYLKLESDGYIIKKVVFCCFPPLQLYFTVFFLSIYLSICLFWFVPTVPSVSLRRRWCLKQSVKRVCTGRAAWRRR